MAMKKRKNVDLIFQIFNSQKQGPVFIVDLRAQTNWFDNTKVQIKYMHTQGLECFGIHLLISSLWKLYTTKLNLLHCLSLISSTISSALFDVWADGCVDTSASILVVRSVNCKDVDCTEHCSDCCLLVRSAILCVRSSSYLDKQFCCLTIRVCNSEGLSLLSLVRSALPPIKKLNKNCFILLMRLFASQ